MKCRFVYKIVKGSHPWGIFYKTPKTPDGIFLYTSIKTRHQARLLCYWLNVGINTWEGQL